MFNQEWAILIVDDEPDVLTISTLVMKNFEVYGIPVKIYTAASKAAAIELLNTTLSRPALDVGVLAVAFIDVVMETDTAGLELCEYIRDTLRNKVSQIYIRTGQPGIAPERTVIDRHDINGYFSKFEATEDKLYSLVKSGVRQYYFAALTLRLFLALDRLVALAPSREAMTKVILSTVSDGLLDEGSGQNADAELKSATWIDGKLLGVAGFYAQAAQNEQSRLETMQSITLSAAGDKYVIDGKMLYIKIAATPANAEIMQITNRSAMPPDFSILLMYRFLKSAAALWKNAQ